MHPRSACFEDSEEDSSSIDFFSLHDSPGLQTSLMRWIWRRVQALYQRVYFRRRWVLQESFQAHTATIYCGERYEINWAKFYDAFHVMHTISMGIHSFTTVPGLFLHIHSVRKFWVDNSLVRLLQYMAHFEDAECQDPRDRMYALLSFDTGQAFEPDY